MWRQNVAEIDEIPFQDEVVSIDLPTAERAIYLELEHHLQALEMKQSKGLSRKRSTSDRAARLLAILQESADAEEALLKRSSHFDLHGGANTALEACQKIVDCREAQMSECEEQLRKDAAKAYALESDIKARMLAPSSLVYSPNPDRPI